MRIPRYLFTIVWCTRHIRQAQPWAALHKEKGCEGKRTQTIKPFNKTHLQNIDIDIFQTENKSKSKQRSQHAKDQVELKLEVSYCTTNLEENGTEVLHQRGSNVKPASTWRNGDSFKKNQLNSLQPRQHQP